MFGLFKYVMPETGVERFGCQEVYLPTEQLLKKVGQPHEIVEGLSTRLELHENINVTLIIRLSTRERAEDANLPDAEATELVSALTQQREDIIFRFNRHDSSLMILQSATSWP